MKNGWCKKRNSFVQYYGSESLDASNLIMPGLLRRPNDPRMIGTLDAICRDPSEGGLLSNASSIATTSSNSKTAWPAAKARSTCARSGSSKP